ncbi:MAG TPA: 3-oxoacyl-[acyl-carrier-protein] synthase III C-terminal domain-containing protein [Methylomirabilota bacterium]|jgi:predicted naringenin-chalcone synthase|nr:3-oxoacyl-[acyl-carrier-protein] synthase III C-terminal domain-containing protein [Methylomirabilota bacterium]
MATIAATATAHPPHRYSQEEILGSLPLWLADEDRMLVLARRVFANAAVETRYGCRALFDLVRPLSITETSRLYQQYVRELGEQVARHSLAQARVDPKAVDLLITTSCTGFMIPSLDAHLANALPCSPHVKRLPITELGCAAGAVALARAFDYLRAFPDHIVLVIAVELPSLTFQVRDLSPANIVSSALFGDGAAAVVLTGRPQAGQPRILATESTLFPQSVDLMGFELKDSGLHIVLSAEVPEVVCAAAPDLVDAFLARQGLRRPDLTHFLLHPGGRRVLDGLSQRLALPDERTAVSRAILREYGNLSSASVLFILDRFLTQENTQAGERGLLIAFGPGFSAEQLLLEWM